MGMFDGIRLAVMQQAQEALSAAAEDVSQRAKHHAPVRKIFAGPHHTERSSIGLEGERLAVVSETGEALLPGHLQSARAERRLSRRGRYEVSTMRAFHGGEVGGRLRDEIQATAAQRVGSRVEATVISPTPYAKYQEFGTRHNAAHPYLRPALEESREEIMGQLSAAVGKGVRAPVGRTTVRVRVRI